MGAIATTTRGVLLISGALLLSLGCGTNFGSTPETSHSSAESEAGNDVAATAEQAPLCPEQVAPDLLPGVTAEHRDPEYWFRLLAKRHDLDEVLLTPAGISDLNASLLVERPSFHPQQDLLEAIDVVAFQEKIDDRFVWMKEKLDTGEYVRDPGPTVFDKPESPAFAPEFRVALGEVQLYCAAGVTGFYDADATSKRIDRNRCSAAHDQELVEILAPWTGGMMLARTATSWGFVKEDAPLSPVLSDELAARFARGPFGILSTPVDRETTVGAVALADHTRLAYANDARSQAHVATAQGFAKIALDADAHVPTRRPLTRRAIIEEALSFLGTPYGFGGLDGGIDCSRLLLDVFASFGLKLPRFSGWQAKAGSYSFDVEGVDEDTKQEIIDQSTESGIVILQLPGHIMLYLGRDEAGVPMGVHALSYYLEPCEDGGDQTMVVGKVQVGGLELGRDTRKTALIERITRVTVIGKPPVDELRGIATLRPAAPVHKPTAKQCRKLPGRRMFVSPEKPRKGTSVHVVATSRRDLGPATISLFDSKGRRHDSIHTQTNGPPNGFIAQLEDPPTTGRWMAVLGDGEKRYACRRFWVRRKARPSPPPRRPGRTPQPTPEEEAALAALPPVPVWELKRGEWSTVHEDLFATFNERLFDYPADEDVTWPNLHTVLRDPNRNILFNYFGKDEENHMKLVPDCADLPYTLRAYFSWKLGLPFGVHECRRAREGRAPTCDLIGGNLMSRAEFDLKDWKVDDEIEIFEKFVDRHVRRLVHSSSGRTGPEDDLSDFYPVPLNRRSLRPGTLFTDPYGHLLVVVRWIKQGPKGYGALIGADAQPDGTIGRRRFWRGSFLFHPETGSGGAGFKAFRPWSYDEETGALVTTPNEDLRRSRTARFSREQYRGSESDFYDKMEALINPRALDPIAKLRSLVDALEEQVSRRTTSVINGEEFMKSRGFAPIDMPTGAKIFLTRGPWEDFSTPSRDWRLLIAIHTVVDFPDAVRRSPQQYGVEAANAEARASELSQELDKELASRGFSYTRSDGSEWKLTLKDLIDRRVDFEMSYNPNDCVEIRWAAPTGSEEAKTCDRHAPEEQRLKMREYRPWFAERRRPAS